MAEPKIITKEELQALFDDEAAWKKRNNSSRDVIDYDGSAEINGHPHALYTDQRNGKQYAVRTIRDLYMGFNSNEGDNVQKFVEIVEREGAAKAYWGVTGRTRHVILANQLKAQLPQYQFEIGYDSYLCVARKEGADV